jgi:ubiquinone/menaquinone biosynthesis C-methylase UbiE
MILSNRLFKIKSFFGKRTSEIIRTPKEGYKIWSESYDDEKDNLMLTYDEIILKTLLSKIDLSGKTILDYGCGTGRNWFELLKHDPDRIIGCDISSEMIDRLKRKYSFAESFLIKNDKLNFLSNKECDIIISTLVISHVYDIENLFIEWDRVLKDSGDIIISDFHPDLFAKGGTRTFKQAGKSYKIQNYIHHLREIEELLCRYGFTKITLIEKMIDEEVKGFYIKKNAEHIYSRFMGIPFIYGIYLKR